MRSSPLSDAPPQPVQRNWRQRLLTAFPFVGTVVVLIWIFRKVPLDRFRDALVSADYPVFFCALLPFSVCYFALDTRVLQFVMEAFHGPIPFRALLPVRAVDYLISILNHRLSQGAMLVYLARRSGVHFLEIGSTILFLDFLQKTHLVFWASVGMLFVYAELPPMLLYVPVTVIGGWALFLAFVHGRFGSFAAWLTPKKWRLLRSFRLASFRHFATVLVLKAPLILLSVLAHHLAMKTFGIEIGMLRLLATLPIIFLVGALPVTVARLGTAQAAWIFFHGDIAEPAKLLAYGLASHLTFMLANAALGAAFWGRAYNELFRDARVDGRSDSIRAGLTTSA